MYNICLLNMSSLITESISYMATDPYPGLYNTTRVGSIVLFVIAIMGTLGNAFLLTIILCNKKLRSHPTMMLISSLTACDLIGGQVFSLGYILFIFNRSLSTYWLLCSIVGMITETAFLAHSIHMFCLALNRYIYVCHPFKVYKWVTVKVTKWEILAIWSISILVRIGHQHSGPGIVFIPNVENCLMGYNSYATLIFTIHMYWQYINICVISFLYFLILKRMRKQRIAITSELVSNITRVTSATPISRLKSIQPQKGNDSKLSHLNNEATKPMDLNTPITTEIISANSQVQSRAEQMNKDRKARERDVAWYSLSMFGVFLFVTLTFTASDKIIFKSTAAKYAYYFIFNFFFCFTFTMNSLISFAFTRLFRTEAKLFTHQKWNKVVGLYSHVKNKIITFFSFKF